MRWRPFVFRQPRCLQPSVHRISEVTVSRYAAQWLAVHSAGFVPVRCRFYAGTSDEARRYPRARAASYATPLLSTAFRWWRALPGRASPSRRTVRIAGVGFDCCQGLIGKAIRALHQPSFRHDEVVSPEHRDGPRATRVLQGPDRLACIHMVRPVMRRFRPLAKMVSSARRQTTSRP